MNYKKIPQITAVILTLLFCLYVVIFEKQAYTAANDRLKEHARIISDDLWNYNKTGAYEYLKLASESDDYEALVVTGSDGVIFQEIQTPVPIGFTQSLINIKLIPRVKLLAYIEYNNNIIGWFEVIWLPRTIFIHAYVFFALVMALIVISLYARILKEKARLEHSVLERTNELSETNKSLTQEIEERIKIEEALRESEEKHRFLAENINDVIWTTDLSLNYTYISPVSSRLHGWKPEELSKLSIHDVLTPESVEKATTLFAKHYEEGHRTGNFHQSAILELEMNNSDGSTIWCEIIASFMLGDDQKPVGIMGVTRDITDRIRNQKEREELQERLERSKKMESLGLLAGGVAHDLNNVLSGIVTYPELLLLDIPVDSPYRKPIQSIKKSGQKAAAIVEDLLTLARRGVVAREALEMNGIIREYLDSPEYLKLLSYHPHVKINLNLEEPLPFILGSAVHIKKTIMNLVSNAAEAQPDGGSVTVTTESRYLDKPKEGYYTISEGEYIVLRVSDNGEGISSEDLQHIFEPFYTKKVMGRSGTGLGLAVVWGTVKDHNGYININSELKEGTEFELYFPISRNVMTQKQPSPVTLEDVMGNHQTILIVDDIPEQREIATSMLTRLNYSVHSVSSGEDAIEYLKDQPVDLVILDMIMEPGIDGLETYGKLLEINPEQKAIIASGFSETDRVKEAQKLGAGDYVKKPYMFDTLGKAIKTALNKS